MPYGITQCYLQPGSSDFPAVTQSKLVLGLATPEGCKAELICVVVIILYYLKIVYMRKTVTCLGNNQAVSCQGFEPATTSHTV